MSISEAVQIAGLASQLAFPGGEADNLNILPEAITPQALICRPVEELGIPTPPPLEPVGQDLPPPIKIDDYYSISGAWTDGFGQPGIYAEDPEHRTGQACPIKDLPNIPTLIETIRQTGECTVVDIERDKLVMMKPGCWYDIQGTLVYCNYKNTTLAEVEDRVFPVNTIPFDLPITPTPVTDPTPESNKPCPDKSLGVCAKDPVVLDDSGSIVLVYDNPVTDFLDSDSIGNEKHLSPKNGGCIMDGPEILDKPSYIILAPNQGFSVLADKSGQPGFESNPIYQRHVVCQQGNLFSRDPKTQQTLEQGTIVLDATNGTLFWEPPTVVLGQLSHGRFPDSFIVPTPAPTEPSKGLFPFYVPQPTSVREYKSPTSSNRTGEGQGIPFGEACPGVAVIGLTGIAALLYLHLSQNGVYIQKGKMQDGKSVTISGPEESRFEAITDNVIETIFNALIHALSLGLIKGNMTFHSGKWDAIDPVVDLKTGKVGTTRRGSIH